MSDLHGPGGPGRRPGDQPDQQDPDRPPEGHIHNTPPGVLAGFAVTGLVLGWLLRPVAVRLQGSAPLVGWLPVGVLFFVALVLGYVAWHTYRTLHRQRGRIAPTQAVNRLVLAKSCALVGALVGGGYFGYALSFLGLTDAALARQRVLQSVLAGVAGVLWVVASLLLERACRVHEDDD